MKNQKANRYKTIITVTLSILLLTCVYVSVLAEGAVIDYNGGTSSYDDGGIKIEVGSQITPSVPSPPAPPVTPPATVQPVTPPTATVSTPETVSSAPSSRYITPSDMPPPPSADPESEFNLDIGVDLSSTVATPSDLYSSTAAGGRSLGMSFFADNWWWIVGCAVAIIGLIIAIMVRRNK